MTSSDIIDIMAVVGALASVANTAMIWHILNHKDGQIARLTSALLFTKGESQAAKAVTSPLDAKVKALREVPTVRNARIGMTPRGPVT